MENNVSRLKERYRKEILPILMEEFGIKNKHAVPKVKKVVINIGAGEISKNKEYKDMLLRDLAAITGQLPSVRLAKVSVANFGIREGQAVGVSVSLRGERMYHFLDKLFSITLPRLRDFRGVSLNSFDKGGNYTLGIDEYTVFPEVDVTKITKPMGLAISIVIDSGNIELSRRLLELMGMPFEKK